LSAGIVQGVSSAKTQRQTFSGSDELAADLGRFYKRLQSASVERVIEDGREPTPGPAKAKSCYLTSIAVIPAFSLRESPLRRP
jgi:hypothetical protein